MPSLKQSIAWWCFVANYLTPHQLIHAARELGYDGLDLVPPEYWSLVRDQGLTISAIVGHQSLTEGLNRIDQHDRIEREIHTALQQAEAWDIPNLVCFSGNRSRQNDADGAEITAMGLQRVARAAEDAGVNLVLELLNSKVDHPDYQCDHTTWGVTVCQLVNSPRVKLLYDIYHMQIMEGDIIRTIETYHSFFGHYHTAGNPGRHEITGPQELNYNAIVGAIAATGYTEYIGHEFIPQGDPMSGLKAAFNMCAVQNIG